MKALYKNFNFNQAKIFEAITDYENASLRGDLIDSLSDEQFNNLYNYVDNIITNFDYGYNYTENYNELEEAIDEFLFNNIQK